MIIHYPGKIGVPAPVVGAPITLGKRTVGVITSVGSPNREGDYCLHATIDPDGWGIIRTELHADSSAAWSIGAAVSDSPE